MSTSGVEVRTEIKKRVALEGPVPADSWTSKQRSLPCAGHLPDWIVQKLADELADLRCGFPDLRNDIGVGGVVRVVAYHLDRADAELR